jgi:hypothetical protein
LYPIIGYGADLKMHETALNIVQILQNEEQENGFAIRLTRWLLEEAPKSETQAADFTASRAKALLRADNLLNEATLNDFSQLIQRRPAVRVAIYTLLADTKLAENPTVASLTHLHPPDDDGPIQWTLMILAAYCWKGNYPLYQLDPASPPDIYSPAGQAVRRSAGFIRGQVQLSATERDKMARRLAEPPSGAPSIDELQASGEVVAPLPPHYRPPIPEQYPEIASETVQVDMEDVEQQPTVSIGDPLVITEDELTDQAPGSSEPVRMPPITIGPSQVVQESGSPPSPMPSSAVVLPSQSNSAQARPNLTLSLRQVFKHEELKTTKLLIVVQDYPDGPGIYGLQVKVTCQGIKSYVAGATNREGKFFCELPVRIQSGLTYDVAVTWPRAEGGDVEYKSITLNADRTRFTLPFYRQLESPASDV